METVPVAAGVTEAGGADKLLAAALHSDRLYFEAGASLTGTDDFTLATMPGFERLAAGNVGFLGRWPDAGTALSARISGVEALFRTAGAASVRFYAPAPSTRVHRQMTGIGYAAREERAYGFRAAPLPGRPRLAMFPVRSDADWAEKLELQRCTERPPDGHACRPEDWLTIERQKALRSGLMFQLFCMGSKAMAAAAFLPVSEGVFRFKNFLVRADARRRGMAREALGLALGHVFDRGAEYMVLLAIAGSPAERVYAGAGGMARGSVWEYSKAIEP